MTDDRHTFSAPRPIVGRSEPTWEVDVFRDGVEHPIVTLTIDSTTLPPRYGKKKKIVWQLPDDVQQTPKFAVDEKRRLLDLFKHQKKSRKKVKRPLGLHSDEEDDNDDEVESESPKAVAVPRKRPEEDYKDYHRATNNDSSRVNPKPQTPPLGNELPIMTFTMEQAPPGLVDNRLTVTASREHGSTTVLHSSEGALPPPGFGMSQLQLENSLQYKYFSLASMENVPVELAKLFMDTYYPSLTYNEDLLPYFYPDAQKSLSVGTAHAFCASKEEISVQLASLSNGSQWDVRGVVAQQGVAGSVILLMTGSVLTKTSPLPFTFAHSIALIPIQSSEGRYQIHNDTLVLMAA
jgi:hypothetical protein